MVHEDAGFAYQLQEEESKYRINLKNRCNNTKISLEEQSDQGLHCLQFCLHLLEALLYDKASLFKF